MPQFIAKNPQSAETLKQKMSQTMFQSPEKFVNFYNSGLINRRHADVAALAQEIADTYSDVRLQGGVFVFITSQEVQLEELLRELQLWNRIVRIKRDLQGLLDNNTLSAESVLAFTAEDLGYLHEVQDDEQLVRVSNEKFFAKDADQEAVFERLSTAKELAAEGVYTFNIRDFVQADDSFVSDMSELLPRH